MFPFGPICRRNSPPVQWPEIKAADALGNDGQSGEKDFVSPDVEILYGGKGKDKLTGNSESLGTVSHVGVALSFGLVVLAMIYAVGDVSGAHLNPAVTLGFYAARRLPRRWVLPYIASQCAGALAASGVLRLLFPGHADLG